MRSSVIYYGDLEFSRKGLELDCKANCHRWGECNLGHNNANIYYKSSLSFPAKVWWAVVHGQLRQTANDNTLSPSLASLAAWIMVGYPINIR